MRPESRKLIWDARDASNRVLAFCYGKSFDDYLADEMLSSAVERQIEIIGEALNRLSRVEPALAERIAELSKIVGMRNVLIHGYSTVDHRLVWDVVASKISGLATQLETLSAET